MDKLPPRLLRRRIMKRDINDEIIPFITMKYLSDKQEETIDKNKFQEQYGFLFRDYELTSNIIEKHKQKDDTYISDIKSSIIALKNSQNKYIKEVYSKLNEDKYDNEFYEEVLRTINSNLNLYTLIIRNNYMESRIEDYFIPIRLHELIADLATSKHEITNIYDPSCREALIISSLQQFNHATLYEKDEKIYTQAIQNFIINDVPLENIDIQNKEVIFDEDDKKYDTVLSITYPIPRQRKLFEEIEYENLKKFTTRNPRSIQLLNLIEHLDDKGLLITTVTQDILVRKDSIELRKCLIENNMLDAVIEYRTGMRTEIIILIINKNKKTDDILFIKENRITSSRSKIIHDKIVDCYKNREKIKHFSNIVTKEEIKENEYKIIPKRYVYTLKYETRNISEVIDEQKRYTQQIHELDDEISRLLNELNK